jgi:hypothetical protein
MKNLNKTIERVLNDEGDVRAATAPFQAEFPYEREEEAQVTRREFCNFLGLTSAALFLGAGGFAAKAALDARTTESFSAAHLSGAETHEPNSAFNIKITSAT